MGVVGRAMKSLIEVSSSSDFGDSERGDIWLRKNGGFLAKRMAHVGRADVWLSRGHEF